MWTKLNVRVVWRGLRKKTRPKEGMTVSISLALLPLPYQIRPLYCPKKRCESVLFETDLEHAHKWNWMIQTSSLFERCGRCKKRLLVIYTRWLRLQSELAYALGDLGVISVPSSHWKHFWNFNWYWEEWMNGIHEGELLGGNPSIPRRCFADALCR